jgi:uncharacterized membrane protein HdeD (DUF308 family)
VWEQVFWHNSRNKREKEEAAMLGGLGLYAGIASLVFGIVVMIFPKILNYLVGIYFIVIGVILILIR